MARKNKRSAATSPPSFSQHDAKTYLQWQQVSELVQACRASGLPTAANDALSQLIATDPKGTLAPFFQLWLADNHVLAGELRQAISAYRQIQERYSERRFCGEAFGAIAVRSMAHAHAHLGEVLQALEALDKAADDNNGACYPAQLAYMAGCIAERAGFYDEALTAFSKSANVKEPFRRGAAPCQDLALRAARRLQSERVWVRKSLDVLVDELSAALKSGNRSALASLASQTHFSVAALGSESSFLDVAPVLEVLFDDLPEKELRISTDCLGGSGDKRYLDSFGWKGKLGSDVVRFILTRGPGGFEWRGIAFLPSTNARDGERLLLMARRKDDIGNDPLPGDPHEPPEGPDPPAELPPLGVSGAGITVSDLAMKSPWKSGSHFYAGGIIPFVGRIATIKAIVTTLGPIAALIMDRLIPESDCGFGFGGLYYGQPTTHVGTSSFAVDFASFGRIGVNLAALVPLDPLAIVQLVLSTSATYPHPCLAVADGIVTFVSSATPTGGVDAANEVYIHHIAGKEQGAVAIVYILALLNGSKPTVKLRYSAHYLHLDGPSRISVSLGMYVKQGKRLGPMDDTGNSVGHHLHFELYDNLINFTVRPTPMDGQTLENWDDGRCMHSTNVLIP